MPAYPSGVPCVNTAGARARLSKPPACKIIAVVMLGCLVTTCSRATSTLTTPATPKPDVVARLDNLPQGLVRLSVNQRTPRISVHLEVTGLAPGVAHAIHLHRGTCLARTADAVASFSDVRSDSKGRIAADTTAIGATSGGIPKGVYIDLHLVGDAHLGASGGATSIPLACADVADGAATTAVRLFPTPGYKPFGSAALTYAASRRSLDVHLSASSLISGTSHAVVILSGTCVEPGAVIHDVGNLTADAQGNVTTTLTLTGIDAGPPAGGWIVIVRDGSSAEIGASAQPSPLEQPILCGPLTTPT